MVLLLSFFRLLLLLTLRISLPLSVERLLYNRTVLLVGDSLTHGLYRAFDRIGTHPYSNQLSKRLNDSSIYVENRGANGALARDMSQTLPELLTQFEKSTPGFVIILAGTNDLNWKVPEADIFASIKTMHMAVQSYALAIKRNIYSMALSIPQLAWSVDQQARVTINAELKAYAERCKTLISYLNMDSYFDQTNMDHLALWSVDFVHLSPVGYDKLGDLVYERLVEFAERKGLETLSEMDFTEVCI